MYRLAVTRIVVLLVTGIVCNSCSSAHRHEARDADAAPRPSADGDTDTYYDIGSFHRPVTTESAKAQRWFDRGLAMCYAFNHEEAVRCFEYALEEDPSMPMALWGMAYAWGPNINNLEIPAHQIAQAAFALRLAELQSKRASALERDLIGALAHRYSVPAPNDRQPLNKAYSDEMRKVYQAHSDDPLIASLFAESLMILRPWNHWSKDGKPASETPEIMSVLEGALEKYPDYPGLCHLYIHTMEASPTPEKALPAANRLRASMPGAGHLVHMPSHIDVLTGDYKSAIEANLKAIAADAEFVKHEGRHNFYTFYRIHNYHFVVYGAMFDGQSELALRTARQIAGQVPEDMLKEMTDFLDAFMPTPLHVLIRFGRWEDILAEPEPVEYLPMTRSVWHYARGIAFATTGRVPEAEEELKRFKQVRATVPETSILFNNTSRDILGVAETMLAGEITYRKGEHQRAFEYLREAVQLDDALNYDEPWGWMQPARHALGALLLEQGQLEQAESVYRADLTRHPHNAWALHGLAESLERQGKASEAFQVQTQYDIAVARTDVDVDRSCFCRLGK